MNLFVLMAGVAVLSALNRSRRRITEPIIEVHRPPETQTHDVALRAPVILDEPPTLPPTPQPRAKKAATTLKSRRRTQQIPDIETFSDLLERLDDSFGSLHIPPIKGNWLPKSDIRALHKMGVFVPSPWAIEAPSGDVRVDTSVLPNMASAHMMSKKYDVNELIYPRFIFAIRERRLPPSVEQFPGTPYRFGMSVELHADERDKQSAMRSFWVWCWVVVDADGLVRIPSELRPAHHTIQHRRNQGPGFGRTSSFVSRIWERPTMLQHDTQPLDEYERFLKLCFRQLLKWWTTRSERWSVAVKKDGSRVTFSIQPEHTSAYFADRNKSVKAPDGTAKKIIHYVNAHARSTGAMVKEHVRGLREFEWHGYSCAVTAPKFTGSVITANFDLPPSSDEDVRAAEPGSLIPMDQVAQILADAEDRDTRKAA